MVNLFNNLLFNRKISLHPNVLRIYGYVEDRKKDVTYLVTEYMSLGDLGSLIKQECNYSIKF